MKNQELFNRTIGILVKAYQNETLRHTDACACAVGNIIVHNEGIKYQLNNRGNIDIPGLENYCKATDWMDYCKYDIENGNVKKQIENTGYSVAEILDIECAFEHNISYEDKLKDDDGYIGLMSVVDTLMIIHEANETEVKQAKDLFVLA